MIKPDLIVRHIDLGAAINPVMAPDAAPCPLQVVGLGAHAACAGHAVMRQDRGFSVVRAARQAYPAILTPCRFGVLVLLCHD